MTTNGHSEDIWIEVPVSALYPHASPEFFHTTCYAISHGPSMETRAVTKFNLSAYIRAEIKKALEAK